MDPYKFPLNEKMGAARIYLELFRGLNEELFAVQVSQTEWKKWDLIFEASHREAFRFSHGLGLLGVGFL